MDINKMSANDRFEAILNYAVNNRKADLVSLLQANGVLIDSTTPDEQLYTATAKAIKFSPTFKRAFTYYMVDAIKGGDFMNFVGLNPSEQAILGQDFTGEVMSDGMDAFYSMEGTAFNLGQGSGSSVFGGSTSTPVRNPNQPLPIRTTPSGAPSVTESSSSGSMGGGFFDKLRNADTETINKWLGVGFNVAQKVGSFRRPRTGEGIPTGGGSGQDAPTPYSWWSSQSPMAKAGIIGGGVLLIGGIIFLARKK